MANVIHAWFLCCAVPFHYNIVAFISYTVCIYKLLHYYWYHHHCHDHHCHHHYFYHYHHHHHQHHCSYGNNSSGRMLVELQRFNFFPNIKGTYFLPTFIMIYWRKFDLLTLLVIGYTVGVCNISAEPFNINHVFFINMYRD